VKAEALAGGATREPTIERIDGANAMVNDADLTHRLAGVLERELGKDRVVDLPAQMASEEFLGLPMEATGSRVRWHLLTISRVRRLILVVHREEFDGTDSPRPDPRLRCTRLLPPCRIPTS
jgi:hypothetical protein